MGYSLKELEAPGLTVHVPYYVPRPGWRRVPFAAGHVLSWLGRHWWQRAGWRWFLYRIGWALQGRFGERRDTTFALGEWEHTSIWSGSGNEK